MGLQEEELLRVIEMGFEHSFRSAGEEQGA
jgi:hypothetical protein